MTQLKTSAVAVMILLGAAAAALAQPPAPSPPAPRDRQSLKVQVVLSRYQGEKRISSLPYAMTVTTNASPASVRMGAQLPIAMTVQGGVSSTPVPVIESYNYREVGTSIDCSASALDGGRYAVRVTIEDSSVYPDDSVGGAAKTGHPSFRTFKSDQTIVLADGQSAQYTTATDKVTGEVVKVDVTLTVLK